MKYAVDEIIDNIVTLEDIETKEKKYIEKELLPEDIYDGAILIYEDDTYKLDISEETLRRKRIIEKLNSKIEGSNVKIKEQSGERKDRYSSLGYSYMVARQIEVDYKLRNNSFDPSKFIMSKQPKTRIL